MKLCYAEDNGSSDDMNDSLMQWTVGAGLAAMTAILGFLLRWVFGKVTDGVETGVKALREEMSKNAAAEATALARIEGDLRRLADTQQRQDTALQLLRKDFEHLQEGYNDLKHEFEGWREQHAQE